MAGRVADQVKSGWCGIGRCWGLAATYKLANPKCQPSLLPFNPNFAARSALMQMSPLRRRGASVQNLFGFPMFDEEPRSNLMSRLVKVPVVAINTVSVCFTCCGFVIGFDDIPDDVVYPV